MNSTMNNLSNSPVINLENDQIILRANLYGGAIFDFHLKDIPINPVNFRTKDLDGPPFMGHFLCFDRWGPPTEAEKRYGFDHHGEVNTQQWELVSPVTLNQPGKVCIMKCSLPMGKLQLTRKIKLSDTEPLVVVTEEIKNLNTYGRMFNIVQHVSLAPPFLDKNTLFDNNTEKGFENKENGSPDQEEPVILWPKAEYNGKKINLRQFEDPWPRVSSFVYHKNEKHAWVTACNPMKNIMLGYIWEVKDYPWINFWRSMENNIPAAFGMEFGTTGLHEPFPVVAKKAKIFDRNIFDFIDADEVISKSYIAFLAKIPENYAGVGKIIISDKSLIIQEKNINSRNIKYSI